jgi:catechol 2,3-dioxygenase-like lactoylglutathione lyase family enzyme
MRRFHVHVSVQDIEQSVRFYSAMFGAAPTIHKADYAKWMIDDPRVNFAISKRGVGVGINHLGLQFDSDAELAEHHAQIDAAGVAAHTERAAACCYVESDKHWIADPQGIAWEAFHTLNEIPVFGVDSGPKPPAPAARRIIPILPASGTTDCCKT